MKSIEDIALYARAHKGIDIELHLDALFGNLTVANLNFLSLFRECILQTQTPLGGWKVFRRAQRAFTLARYVERTAQLAAPKIECGVFQGFSALLACKVLKALDSGFDGSGYCLCDSYEGLSSPSEGDLIYPAGPANTNKAVLSHAMGHFAVDLNTVQARFGDFPGLDFQKGWIPEVFSNLLDTTWSFVHIDVDLYGPTYASLEYFHPRLEKGGVILNDDFGSPLFPGGGRAWMDYFDSRGLPYLILDTGQSVFVQN